VLIVIIHQGVENSRYVDNASRKTALQVVEAGADCVICHHTHTVQGIEFFKRGLIFHGTGNFLIDFDVKHRPHAAYSIALRLELAEGCINKVTVEPFRINEYLQPCPLDEKMRDKFPFGYNRIVETAKFQSRHCEKQFVFSVRLVF